MKFSKEKHLTFEEAVEIHVEVWDTSDGQYAYQLFIDFDNRTVEVKPYDVKK
ncbi:hypothetical protein [[Clostridium] symbiosum]|uniref:hypothetical protein n=1 Tax=Clostridium symbiosum TaxID=1512 RepID=UPI001FC855FF|nr:hypothetical protein [[Clostridium] symbiosum]